MINSKNEKMSKVILDQESFKALGASKRIYILKLLNEKPHTQAELAKALGIKPASVNEHLKELIKAKLIIQNDDGRKWKYYKLTEKAKCILEPERKTIWITLGVLIFSFAGTILSYTKGLFANSQKYITQPSMQTAKESIISPAERMFEVAPKTAIVDLQNKLAEESIQNATNTIPSTTQIVQLEPNYLLWFFTGLTIISLIILLAYFLKMKFLKNN